MTMNFDPQTEADNQQQTEKSLVTMYAGACAYLQACFDETRFDSVAEAFQNIWTEAMRYTTPVQFYLEIIKASEALGFS